MLRFFTSSKDDSTGPQKEVLLLGRRFPYKKKPEENEEFMLAFRSLFWVTYRKYLPPIPGTDLTSDSGWGCMVRVGQMAMAHALQRLYLNNSWSGEVVVDEVNDQILRAVSDVHSPQHPFSIHNVIEVGPQFGIHPGEWFGPYSISLALKTLIQQFEPLLAPIVVNDGVLNIEDVNAECSQGGADWVKQLLLLVPLRLGVDKTNPKYLQALYKIYGIPEFSGMLGGRPRHSVYLVGVTGSRFIVLDPHTTQPWTPPPPPLAPVNGASANGSSPIDSDSKRSSSVPVERRTLHSSGSQASNGAAEIRRAESSPDTSPSSKWPGVAPGDARSWNRDSVFQTFKCSKLQYMSANSLDPSVALMFVCPKRSSFEKLCENLQKVFDETGTPLFAIKRGKSHRKRVTSGEESKETPAAEEESSSTLFKGRVSGEETEEDWDVLEFEGSDDVGTYDEDDSGDNKEDEALSDILPASNHVPSSSPSNQAHTVPETQVDLQHRSDAQALPGTISRRPKQRRRPKRRKAPKHGKPSAISNSVSTSVATPPGTAKPSGPLPPWRHSFDEKTRTRSRSGSWIEVVAGSSTSGASPSAASPHVSSQGPKTPRASDGTPGSSRHAHSSTRSPLKKQGSLPTPGHVVGSMPATSNPTTRVSSQGQQSSYSPIRIPSRRQGDQSPFRGERVEATTAASGPTSTTTTASHSLTPPEVERFQPQMTSPPTPSIWQRLYQRITTGGGSDNSGKSHPNSSSQVVSADGLIRPEGEEEMESEDYVILDGTP